MITRNSSRIFNSVLRIALTLCCFALTMQSYGQEVRLRFENNRIDDGGHTVTGNNGYINWEKAEGSYSGEFENKYADIEAVSLGNVFTIAGWYMIYNYSGVRNIMSNQSASPLDGFIIRLDYSKIKFITGNGSSTSEITSIDNCITSGVWFHFAWVVNKSAGTYSLYINGVLKQASGSLSSSFNTSGNIRLGMGYQSQYPLYGYIDDIQMYTCELSEIDINTIKSGGVGSCGTVAVTGVTVSPTSANIVNGSTQQLTATVIPSNATNKNVSWSSSNTSVATVTSSGLVTAVAVGNATITVTTQDGNKTATCAVSVTSSTIPVTGVTVSPTTATIVTGGTQQLTATVLPSNATNQNVMWSSDNTSVATVSSSGLVTGIAEGNATITVTTVDQTKTATCAVTVSTSTDFITLDPSTDMLFDRSSSYKTVNVTSSPATWTVTADQTWIVLSVIDNILKVTVLENTGSLRSGQVTVTAGTAVQIINVTQEAYEELGPENIILVPDLSDFTSQNFCTPMSIVSPLDHNVLAGFGLYKSGETEYLFTAYGPNPLNSKRGIYILPDGKVGIGTTNPNAQLHVQASEGNTQLARFSNNDYNGSDIGTSVKIVTGSPSGVTYAALQVLTNGSANSGALILNPTAGNVGIGTTNPTEKLTVNGTIKAERIDVVSDVPASDHVFSSGYKLMSLAELDAFIQANKHLPEVPTAEEFQQNGYSVGEMDDLLLRKIEELTLYIIELEKKNRELIERIEKLEE